MAKILSNLTTLIALIVLIVLYQKGTFNRMFGGDEAYMTAADQCYAIVGTSTQALDNHGLDIANNESFRQAVSLESTCLSLENCAGEVFESETCKTLLGRFQREILESNINQREYNDFGTY